MHWLWKLVLISQPLIKYPLTDVDINSLLNITCIRNCAIKTPSFRWTNSKGWVQVNSALRSWSTKIIPDVILWVRCETLYNSFIWVEPISLLLISLSAWVATAHLVSMTDDLFIFVKHLLKIHITIVWNSKHTINGEVDTCAHDMHNIIEPVVS